MVSHSTRTEWSGKNVGILIATWPKCQTLEACESHLAAAKDMLYRLNRICAQKRAEETVS